ncbi:MAG: ABC transporter permease [Firmicutes bacterium]|nr:ABC transporter permease [Bacillota bacterium]
MRGALLICKKEFMELMKDRKTMFFTFLLPVLLYPAIFGMMSKLGRNDEEKRKSKASRVAVVDASQTLLPLLRTEPTLFEVVSAPEGDVKQAINDEKLEMQVEVDEDAAAKLEAQQTFSVKATYDRSNDSSRLALTRLKEQLQKQDKTWVQARLKTMGAPADLASPTKLESVDAGGESRVMGRIMGSMLPYLLMIMMFAGSMQHGIYATAGEKERGTLLSLLATSLPRNQIVLGKLLYVFSIGILSALINLASLGISMLLTFSKEAAVNAPSAGPGMGSLSALANPATLALTFFLMVPLGLCFANFIVLMGVQAKNAVEAGSSIMPGFFAVMMMAVFSMAPGIEKMAWLPYVPILNVSLAIRKLFVHQGNIPEYLLALVMTVGLAAVFTWLSTRMLKRESALFKV